MNDTNTRSRRCCIFSTGFQVNFWLTLVLIIYLFLGAYMFHVIEESHVEDLMQFKEDSHEKLLDTLWNLNLNYSDREAWNEKAESAIAEYEAIACDTPSRPWSFSTGLYLVVTAITTIGYGDVAPITQTGRVLMLLYCVVGVPLNLLFLSNYGVILASFTMARFRKVRKAVKKTGRKISKKMNESTRKDSSYDLTTLNKDETWKENWQFKMNDPCNELLERELKAYANMGMEFTDEGVQTDFSDEDLNSGFPPADTNGGNVKLTELVVLNDAGQNNDVNLNGLSPQSTLTEKAPQIKKPPTNPKPTVVNNESQQSAAENKRELEKYFRMKNGHLSNNDDVKNYDNIVSGADKYSRERRNVRKPYTPYKSPSIFETRDFGQQTDETSWFYKQKRLSEVSSESNIIGTFDENYNNGAKNRHVLEKSVSFHPDDELDNVFEEIVVPGKDGVASHGNQNNSTTRNDEVKRKSDDSLARGKALGTLSAVYVLYTVLGAIFMYYTEYNWTFVDAIYCTFISLATIGFGDLIPGLGILADLGLFRVVVYLLFTYVGLIIFSACFALSLDKIRYVAGRVRQKIHITGHCCRTS